MQTHIAHHHHAPQHHHSHDHGQQLNSGGASMLITRDSVRQAGQLSILEFQLRNGEGTSFRDYEITHEERVHLVIVRDGLDTFAHLHPQILSDGKLTVAYTFPLGGIYHLYADFRPMGGPNIIASADVHVSGETPAAPILEVNLPGRVVGHGWMADITPDFGMDGQEVDLRFELLDGLARPIENLRPHMGARGHLQMVSSDGQDYVHTHPLDHGPDEASHIVSFHATFRKSGIYKGWGQFLIGDAVQIVPFVMDAYPRSSLPGGHSVGGAH